MNQPDEPVGPSMIDRFQLTDHGLFDQWARRWQCGICSAWIDDNGDFGQLHCPTCGATVGPSSG